MTPRRRAETCNSSGTDFRSRRELPLRRGMVSAITPLELEVELPSGRRGTPNVRPLRFSIRGRVIGGVAVTVDITEHKRKEESLLKLRELANIGAKRRPATMRKPNSWPTSAMSCARP